MLNLLTYSAAATAATGFSRFQAVTHPVMLGAMIPPDVDLSAPSALLRPVMKLRPAVNPVIDVLAQKAGLERIAVNSFKGSLKSLDPTALKRFFAAIPGRCLTPPKALAKAGKFSEVKRPSAVKELKDLFSSRVELNSLLDLNFSSRASTPGVYALVRLRPYLQVDFIAEGFTDSLGVDINFPTAGGTPLVVTPLVGLDILERAAEAGFGLLDYAKTAKIREVSLLRDSSIIVSSVPGSPALTSFAPGASLGLDPAVLAPVKAMSLVGAHHETTPVAISDLVLEITDMTLAGSAGRPGLKEYQDHFVSLFQASASGAVCALDTGMGKTVVAVSAILEASQKDNYKALIVVPSGLRNQWKVELERWAPSLSVRVISSSKEVQDLNAKDSFPTVTVVSQDVLTRSASILAKVGFDDLVVDEARVRSFDSPRMKALVEVRTGVKRALTLTGTPSEKSLSEISNLAAFTRNDYTLVSDDKDYDAGRLGSIFFSRSKDDMSVEIPKAKVEVQEFSFSKEEKELYAALLEGVQARKEALVKARKDSRGKDVNALRSSLLSSIKLLRSSVSDPTNLLHSTSALALDLVERNLVAPAAANCARRFRSVKKVKELLKDGQVLVCSEFVNSCQALVSHLQSEGVKAQALTGAQDIFERTLICAAFESGDIDVLVISASAQRGVNLQSAKFLLHLDLPNSSSLLDQRAGRVMRIGSPHQEVGIFHDTCKDTSDEIFFSVLNQALFSVEKGAQLAPVIVISDENSILKVATELQQ